MMFIALKTEDGVIKGKISFRCRMLKVTRQGFYKYLANKDRPWKCQDLADAMRAIVAEEECNDAYGRYHTEEMNIGELKTLIWRHFISYWNNRRICSANEGLPPMVKRQRYYKSLDASA